MKKYLVACYGSLRRGMGNHHYYLSESEYKGTFTTEPEYTLHSLSYYPGLKLNGNHSIVMEVYEVDEDTLKNLKIMKKETHYLDEMENWFTNETVSS